MTDQTPEEIRAKFAALQPGITLPSPAITATVGERPRVEEISARIRMSRKTCNQIFPQIVFSEGEDHVVLTEILRAAKPGEPVACVHGASGQKFAVDHYELDGVCL
jgi:hypothetical protein